MAEEGTKLQVPTKGRFQKLLSGLFTPCPPTPENHFVKKSLVEREGYPIPLTENHSVQKSLAELGFFESLPKDNSNCLRILMEIS